MSDFDFEELDKAVTNVLGDSPAPREAGPVAAAEPAMRPEPSVAPRPVEEKPALSAPATPAPSAQPVSPVASTPSPAIAPRSSINRQPPASGRKGVIDIMAPPSKRPSREANVIAPRSNEIESDNTKPEPISVPKRVPTEDAGLRWPPKPDATEAETSRSSSSEAPQTGEAGPAAALSAQNAPAADDSFERFDSLSSSGFDFSDKKDDTPAGATADTPADASVDTSQSESEKEPQSSQSPFLSDAKVEKRPLGSFSNYTSATDDKPTEEDAPVANEPAKISVEDPVTTPENNEPTPQVDTQQDEAKAPTEPATSPAEASDATPDVPLAAEQPFKEPDVKLDHLLTDGHEHQRPAHSLSDKSPTAMGSMQSIPQQYKVEAAPADDTPHQAFDTKEYHAPLKAHPDAKAHHGNGLLIASIVLLILAIAAAVGIYFYGDKLGL